MSGTVEEYVDKIGRISSEYKQLSRSEVEFNDDGESSPEEIKERKINIYKYIKRKAIKCEDERIAVATLEFTPKMFKYLPKKYKHDKNFFIECVRLLEAPKLFKYADEVIRSDLECSLVALNLDYRLYYFASDKIKSNSEVIELYEWKKEVNSLPKNLPEIDLEKWGPDEDDKYFYENSNILTDKSHDKTNIDETLSQLDVETANNLNFPNVSTIDSTPSSQQIRTTKGLRLTKSSKKLTQSTGLVVGNDTYTEATLDWETNGDIDDTDEDGSINNQQIDDDDPELPPIKKQDKKGLLARLFKK